MLNKATLISRDLKNGWDLIREEIPLGKVYYVDLQDIVKLECGRKQSPFTVVLVDCIMAYDHPSGGYRAYMPLELLRVEADA
jgi:hypothetical protein